MTQGFYKSRFKNLVRDYPINVARKQFYRSYFKFNKFPHPNQYVLILSHMRAGSSLLSRLLCNSPQILGYGETYMHYGADSDLDAMSGKVLYVLRKWLSENGDEKSDATYFLDKLVHNYLIKEGESDLLLNEKFHLVFLLREPEGALPSTMRLLNWDEQSSCKYYVDRIDRLVEYGQKINGKKPFFFIAYQDILHDTDKVFQGVEEFLKLKQPLTEDYQMTTKRGGDQSDNLASGKIIRDKKKQTDIVISPEILEKANVSFNKALAFFSP